jgi:ABC-type polar amino acid transport system ATPase subunit
VERGALVALMGPSGSGKTTILRTIAGLDPFDAGSIVVDDVTLASGGREGRARLRRLSTKVGLVFQFHCLFEHLSAVSNVMLAPVHAHGVKAAAAKARAVSLLRAFGVDHRAGALPRELSGGEAQRVAIARALAVDPPLLLMDEPTASLDADRRVDLARILRTLVAAGQTMVVASHDEEFVRAADRRLLLRAGALVEGSAADGPRAGVS